MFALIVQTVLLFAIVFVVGCVVGCLLRQLFAGDTGTAGDKHLPQTAPAETLPQMDVQKIESKPQPPMPVPPVEPSEPPKVEVPPAGFVDAGSEKQKKAAAGDRRTDDERDENPPAKKKQEKRKSTPTKAPVPPAAKPDNLKLIRGIGPQNEARLNNLGINSFAQIAGWSIKDQTEFGDALSFPGRIEREEWVSQAKVLAKGGTTDFSKRVRHGAVNSSLGDEQPVDTGTKPTSLLSEPREGKGDALTLIDGVGNALEKKLSKLGIYHFDQIAGMSDEELTWLGHSIGFPGRPKRENWAGEAKVLATDGTVGSASPDERGAIKTSDKPGD